jgi:hypothetical protein
MSKHRAPGDLGAHLKDQAERIALVEARETGTGWTNWTPDLFGTSSKPVKGANATRMGRFNVTSDGTVEGWGLIRFGSGMTRGTGTYRLTLPRAAVNPDPRKFTIIGTALVGWSLVHAVCTLHVCGVAGFASNQKAVMALEGGLFVDDTDPASGADLANLHWAFSYEAA